MNLNPEILALETLLNCPVVQDLFLDQGTRFVVFTYEDEDTELSGDDEVLIESAALQISYYTPIDYDYFADKATIKSYLRSNDYIITSIQTFIDSEDIKDTVQLRRTIFSVRKAA